MSGYAINAFTNIHVKANQQEFAYTQRKRQCEYEPKRLLKTLALKTGRIQPQANECWQLPEGRKKQGTDSLPEPKGFDFVKTLTLAQ